MTCRVRIRRMRHTARAKVARTARRPHVPLGGRAAARKAGPAAHERSAAAAAAEAKRLAAGLQRAGAKSREDVVARRDEEVAIARVLHALMGGERAAAQHATAAEPGLRVVAVRMRDEAGVRREH